MGLTTKFSVMTINAIYNEEEIRMNVKAANAVLFRCNYLGEWGYMPSFHESSYDELMNKFAHVVSKAKNPEKKYDQIISSLSYFLRDTEVPASAIHEIEKGYCLDAEEIIRFYKENETLELPEDYLVTVSLMERLCNVLNDMIRDKYAGLINVDMGNGWERLISPNTGKVFSYHFNQRRFLWGDALDRKYMKA